MAVGIGNAGELKDAGVSDVIVGHCVAGWIGPARQEYQVCCELICEHGAVGVNAAVPMFDGVTGPESVHNRAIPTLWSAKRSVGNQTCAPFMKPVKAAA